jgi:aldose 1-epimerase
MAVRTFGRIGDEIVQEISLGAAGGAMASILTRGASLNGLAVPLGDGEVRPVVLGYADVEALAADTGFVGAMVGRCANRIGGARFRLDGRDHVLSANEAGRTTLHGGADGFARRNWRIEAASDTAVELSLISQDGDQGFPGRVEVHCRYALAGAAELDLTVWATSDAPTPVNLANHAYFTLNRGGDCRDHRLRIAADFHLPVDADLIPTGAVLPVAGTDHDFRRPRRIAADHDMAFVLAGAPGDLVAAAEVVAPDGRLRLEVETDQPSLQLYTGQHLLPTAGAAAGLAHGRNAGFCLETQGFVDAPNKRHFPSVTLRPGAEYRHHTLFRFVAA